MGTIQQTHVQLPTMPSVPHRRIKQRAAEARRTAEATREQRVWQYRVENLKLHYPAATEAEIVAALEKHGGHAGKASSDIEIRAAVPHAEVKAKPHSILSWVIRAVPSGVVVHEVCKKLQTVALPDGSTLNDHVGVHVENRTIMLKATDEAGENFMKGGGDWFEGMRKLGVADDDLFTSLAGEDPDRVTKQVADDL